MGEREFHLRLSAQYTEPDNAVRDLGVEVLAESGWEKLELDTQTAGFLLFVYTIFTCQHLYMRTNCAERGLLLDSSAGTIDLVASEDWMIRSLEVGFRARLASGLPDPGDVPDIVARMENCPVSRNLAEIPDVRVDLQLD